jgi:hypothetical protein
MARTVHVSHAAELLQPLEREVLVEHGDEDVAAPGRPT